MAARDVRLRADSVVDLARQKRAHRSLLFIEVATRFMRRPEKLIAPTNVKAKRFNFDAMPSRAMIDRTIDLNHFPLTVTRNDNLSNSDKIIMTLLRYFVKSHEISFQRHAAYVIIVRIIVRRILYI